jgi:RNA polymerase sigma-70 factor (ECF subfamily)
MGIKEFTKPLSLKKLSFRKSTLRQVSLQQHLEERWPSLYRVAYSWCHDPHLSKDLVQETVTKALKNSHQLRDSAVVDTWLFRILVNCWRDICRQRKDCIDVYEANLIHNDSPEKEHQRRNEIDRVRQAVSELNPDHREIITLVDLEQMSYKDVAEVLDIPVGTVMSRLCRARRQLKEALQDLNDTPQQVFIRRVK